VEQKADIRIGHAVADEQQRASEGVGAKPDIERGIECEPIEKVGLGQDERGVIVEVAMKFDDVRNADGGARNLLRVADLGRRPAAANRPADSQADQRALAGRSGEGANRPQAPADRSGAMA
jgi:hypothetical protein